MESYGKGKVLLLPFLDQVKGGGNVCDGSD